MLTTARAVRVCVLLRRKWVWAGVGFELGFAFLLVVLQGLALTWIGREWDGDWGRALLRLAGEGASTQWPC